MTNKTKNRDYYKGIYEGLNLAIKIINYPEVISKDDIIHGIKEHQSHVEDLLRDCYCGG